MLPGVVMAALAAAGCPAISNVQTADTLGKQAFQIGLETTAQRVASPYLPYYGFANMSMRYGLTDTTDVGVRLGNAGVEASAKFLLTEPGARELAVSLLPAVGGGVFHTSRWVEIAESSVTLLAGIPLRRDELVGGIRLGGRAMLGPRHDGELEAGISLGYSLRVSERFGVFSELAIALPLVESSGSSENLGTPSPHAPNASSLQNLVIAQFTVALAFGRQRRR